LTETMNEAHPQTQYDRRKETDELAAPYQSVKCNEHIPGTNGVKAKK